MCTLYGVCTPTQQQQQQPPETLSLRHMAVAEVSSFIGSLKPGGSRDICAPGCTLIELFDTTLIQHNGISGLKLAHFLHAHQVRFTSDMVHNNTARAAHAEWLGGFGVLPAGLKADQALGLTTRLRDALQRAGATVDPTRRKAKRQTLRARASRV